MARSSYEFNSYNQHVLYVEMDFKEARCLTICRKVKDMNRIFITVMVIFFCSQNFAMVDTIGSKSDAPLSLFEIFLAIVGLIVILTICWGTNFENEVGYNGYIDVDWVKEQKRKKK